MGYNRASRSYKMEKKNCIFNISKCKKNRKAAIFVKPIMFVHIPILIASKVVSALQTGFNAHSMQIHGSSLNPLPIHFYHICTIVL